MGKHTKAQGEQTLGHVFFISFEDLQSNQQNDMFNVYRVTLDNFGILNIQWISRIVYGSSRLSEDFSV